MDEEMAGDPAGVTRPAAAWEVGEILLGAAGGCAAGLLAGAVVFQSVVVGLFGALAGAVAGMIVVRKRHEAA